jgi:hypothetical protein
MSKEAPLITSHFAGGSRFGATLTVQQAARSSVANISVEWSPKVPERLTDSEWADYCAGRDLVLRELAARLGGVIACIET